MKDMIVRVIAVLVFLISALCTAAAQDIAAGERSFGKCLPCHSVGPDARNKVGPVLNGLQGRKAGSVPDFKYSDANRNSGIVWSEDAFKEYIRNPRDKIPGTRMFFDGIRSEKEAADLWAYLRQFGN